MRIRTVSFLVLLITALSLVGTANAQGISAIDVFLTMTTQELESGQIKLTYLGSQEEPIPTLVITVGWRNVSWDVFKGWRHPDYLNDALFERAGSLKPAFSVNVEEFQGALRGLKQVITKMNQSMPAELLKPGETLETVLEFERSELTEITFTTKVLSGPGER